jgi:hypothetical protein
MPKNIVVEPRILGPMQEMYGCNADDESQVYALFSTGIGTQKQLREFCKKTDSVFSDIENSTIIEMWVDDKLSGLSALSFIEFDEDEDKDPDVFVLTLDWVVLAQEFIGKGLSMYMAEQCGYFAGSVAIQHMIINNLKKCTFLFTADFISSSGEEYFFKMIEYMDSALEQGCGILKKKFVLEAETDSLQYEFRSKGPSRKKP